MLAYLKSIQHVVEQVKSCSKVACYVQVAGYEESGEDKGIMFEAAAAWKA